MTYETKSTTFQNLWWAESADSVKLGRAITGREKEKKRKTRVAVDDGYDLANTVSVSVGDTDQQQQRRKYRVK